jgi:hypothetical protein
MGTRQLCRLTALFAVGLCVLPAMASGATARWTGKTNQGRAAIAHVGDDGRIRLIKTKYKADCRKPRYTWSSSQLWKDAPEGPIEQGNGQFSDSGPLSGPYKRGSFTVEGSVAGTIADGRIKGTQSLVIRVYNAQKRQIDVCKSNIRFTIRAPN